MRSRLILIRRHTHSLLIHALTPPSENINSLSRRAEPTFTRDNFPLDPFASSSPRFPAPTRLTPVTRYAQRYGNIFSLSHTFARDDGFFLFYSSSHQRVHRGLTANNRVRRTFTASRISSSHPRIAHISSLHHHHHHHQLGWWSSGSSGAQRRTTTTVASGEQFWRAIFNFSLATQLYTHTRTHKQARAHTLFASPGLLPSLPRPRRRYHTSSTAFRIRSLLGKPFFFFLLSPPSHRYHNRRRRHRRRRFRRRRTHHLHRHRHLRHRGVTVVRYHFRPKFYFFFDTSFFLFFIFTFLLFF